MLSFDLNADLTVQLRDFSGQCAITAELVKSLPEEERGQIHRYAFISMVGASTRIENALLTDAEVEWIDTTLSQDGRPTAFQNKKIEIENKLSKDRERSIEEVAGCRNMLRLIYSQARDFSPLTQTAVRALHQELLRHYPPASHYLGRYKAVSNSVVEKDPSGKIIRVVLETVDPGPLTDAAMEGLIRWYNQAGTESPWTVAVACEFVFRFLAIHPFQDGNGRLGRGFFLMALLQSPEPTLAAIAPYLAIDRHIERRKEEYYLTLQRCSGGKYRQDPRKYHIEHFVRFMIKVLKDCLDDLPILRKKYEALKNLSPSSRSVLDCFKEYPEIRLNTGRICEETDLPRRTAIHSLNALLRNGFLQKYGRGAGTRYQLVF